MSLEEGEEGLGESVEFLAVLDALEGEAKADEALLLGNGGTVAVGVGEDGNGAV